MKNLGIKVSWLTERIDDEDDNDGLHFGIYIMDVTLEQYKSDVIEFDAGYGDYDILDAFWYSTKEERDLNFNEILTQNK